MLTTTKKNLLTSTALAACLFTISLPPNTTLANPKGGQVVAGEATITQPNASTVQINQSSQNAVVDWQRFDIAPNETTRFVQPNSNSWTLNRVTGNLGPTAILGTIQANGNIAIVNPDGIVFGQGSRIDVNSLIATTSDIHTDDFMTGRMLFNIPGNPAASIINEGNVSVADLGLVAFVAPGVRNSGVITARLGSVSLAAGNVFTLDLYGDGLINLVADDEIVQEVFDVATGKPVTDLVKNDGAIRANGGLVALTAATARRVVNSVVNNTGIIEANTIGVHKGKITLGAQTTSTKVVKPNLPTPQRVKVSGTLNAYAAITRVTLPKERPLVGGTIEITGEWIDLVDAALNVYGTNGGGTVLIGGDYMGGNGEASIIAKHNITMETAAVQTATYLSANSGTSINADAIKNGDGGKVILWSDDTTVTSASISARGGEDSGDGGFVETSGKQNLAASGLVNVGADSGHAGTWLLDPYDLTISNTDTIFDIEESGGTQTFSAFESGSQISVGTIENALNGGSNVQLIARHGLYGQNQTINKTSGGDASFKMVAGHEMQFSNFDIKSTKNKLEVAFGAPNVIWGNGDIITNGGDLTILASEETLSISNAVVETSGGFAELRGENGLAFYDMNFSTGSGNLSAVATNGTLSFGNNGPMALSGNRAIFEAKNGDLKTGFGKSVTLRGGVDLQFKSSKKIFINDYGFTAVSGASDLIFQSHDIWANFGDVKTNGGDFKLEFDLFDLGTFTNIDTKGGDVSVRSNNDRIEIINRVNVDTGGGDFEMYSNDQIIINNVDLDLGGGNATFTATEVGFCRPNCSVVTDPNFEYRASAYKDLNGTFISHPAGVRIANGTLNIIINGVDVSPTTPSPPPTPVDTFPIEGTGPLDDITFTNDGTWSGSGSLSNLFSDDNGTAGLNITVSGNPAGIQFDTSNGMVQFSLVPGATLQSGTYTITITATDASGQSLPREFKIKVEEPTPVTPPTPVDNPPTKGTNPIKEIYHENGGSGVSELNISNLFADDGGLRNLRITFSGVPTGLTATANDDGSINFISVNDADLPVGNHVIIIFAEDTSGQRVIRTITLNVNNPVTTKPIPTDIQTIIPTNIEESTPPKFTLDDPKAFPFLHQWLLSEGNADDISILFEKIGQIGGQQGIENILDNGDRKGIDYISALFSSISYFPGNVANEIITALGFQKLYIDIDFYEQNEDSMMFSYTSKEGKNYKFLAITGSEGGILGIDSRQNLDPVLISGNQKHITIHGKSISPKGKILRSLIDKSKFIVTKAIFNISIIKTQSLQDSTIVVTGHSQGGMVANIVAAYLQEHISVSGINARVQLATFASPGGGDIEFANHYSKYILSSNYYIKNDSVPKLGLAKNIGQSIELPDTGVPNIFGRISPSVYFDDHKMIQKYLNAF